MIPSPGPSRQRWPMIMAAIASAVVVAIVTVLVVVKVTSGSGHSPRRTDVGTESQAPTSTTTGPATAGPTTTQPAATAPGTPIVDQLAAVPLSDMVAAAGTVGGAVRAPTPLANAPSTTGVKPSVLYIGAEYCPFCAAERWPLIMALSKFGTFDNVGLITSSGSDVNPNTPTFSFHGASYTSPYLTFTAVEEEDRYGNPLDPLTPAEASSLKTYDSAQSIPFVLFDHNFVINGASYTTTALANVPIQQYSQALSEPTGSSPADSSNLAEVAYEAKAVAGHIVATVCAITGNQPASVCSAVPAGLT